MMERPISENIFDIIMTNRYGLRGRPCRIASRLDFIEFNLESGVIINSTKNPEHFRGNVHSV